MLATLVVFGGVITVTQISNAGDRRNRGGRPPATQCRPAPDGTAPSGQQNVTETRQNGRTVRNYWGDGQACTTTPASPSPSTNEGEPNQPAPGTSSTTAPPPLDFGPDECSEGNGLDIHDGFQNGNRCVDTQMGEVANADQNPTLLITSAPRSVGVNQPFTIRVSTRNLIRDRFLPAGQGGYYVDMSILNDQNLVRGHFHSACRELNNTNAAPNPEPAPAFFVATEDNGGGAAPDVIEIRVPGLPNRGTFQCASWAGDASHRIPMMQRANQIPAFDAVRVTVR
ncbi:Pecanex-like protein 1 [Phytohabitans sp. ZYX-F-186]|uniref:Pecanex-like protein 1 n=1 Tax=Phytohabitans maris TaxID=3071409 RepID=A0ABU0ZKY7_9ACTN|nr:Pecanex-like protein 1 [Phytohabitans sp. ZYX-F-186]MDQ7906577.1 Pecanex-like protein 1 [Phytohabitans sp. ZYX-F-186]